MMKNLVYFLCLLFATGLTACKNDLKTKTAGPSEKVITPPSGAIQVEEKPDKERITGIWSSPGKSFWLEFHADGTYISGKGAEIKEENMEWSINDETKILTINSSKGIRNIKYRFEGQEIYFTREGKNKEKLFVRLSERPKDGK